MAQLAQPAINPQCTLRKVGVLTTSRSNRGLLQCQSPEAATRAGSALTSRKFWGLTTCNLLVEHGGGVHENGQPTSLLWVIYKVFSDESGTKLPSTSRGCSLGNAKNDPALWNPTLTPASFLEKVLGEKQDHRRSVGLSRCSY